LGLERRCDAVPCAFEMVTHLFGSRLLAVGLKQIIRRCQDQLKENDGPS
jgi:hypothetical protein